MFGPFATHLRIYEFESRFQISYTCRVTLKDLPVGKQARVERVAGERSFRRRLLELGLVPGTPVRVLRVAPLGDPIELSARGSCLSIRAREAQTVFVSTKTEG